MKVGEDLDSFSREISVRFAATSASEISDLAVKMAGFDLMICTEAIADLRTAMPSHHRMIDGARLMAIARRKHVEGRVEIQGEAKRITMQGIPFDPTRPRPDTRTPEQKRWDKHREQSRAWVDGLDDAERNDLLEAALQHWPEGDERAMFRAMGAKSCLVRDEMIRVSRSRDPKEAA